MKKLLSTLLLVGLLIPTVAEAGFSPEGRKRSRCRTERGVTICRMPKRRCTRKRPCVPPGYYRRNFPMPVIPHH